MPATAEQAMGLNTAQSELNGEARYVARQPILDVRGRVHGYDLLFRAAPEAIFHRDAELAAQTMLDNEVIFGLEHLSNGLPAFIACTEQVLTDGSVLVLPPSLTVLAVPTSLEPTSRLIEACRALRVRGFRLALDNFSWRYERHPLLDQTDYIRINLRHFGQFERKQLVRGNLNSAIMVAQQVMTKEDQTQASAMDFTLFQGDYFCHPVLLKKRKVPTNRLAHFEMVRELYHDPINTRKVSALVRRDAALTYRLLRLVNSPIYGIYQEICSIEAAITVLGEVTFRRVVSLAVLSELNMDQPAEILHLALVRARFCELAARRFSQDPEEQYLLGMLSLLPAMLGVPMEEIVPMLPLRGQVCEALAGAANSERRLLSWLESHERGDWQTCDHLVAANNLDSSQLVQCYLEAVSWAQQPSTS